MRATFAALWLLCVLCAPAAVAGDGNGESQLSIAQFYPVEGSVALPEELKPSMVEISLTIKGDEHKKTFPRADGAFKFSDVPPGTHLLEVVAMGYYFPSIRVDVSARLNGKIHAAYAEYRKKVLPPGLLIKLIKQMAYFEKRQDFNLWKFLTNPMMLMFLFTLICIIFLSNIDPETLKEMQQQAQQQQEPAKKKE